MLWTFNLVVEHHAGAVDREGVGRVGVVAQEVANRVVVLGAVEPAERRRAGIVVDRRAARRDIAGAARRGEQQDRGAQADSSSGSSLHSLSPTLEETGGRSIAAVSGQQAHMRNAPTMPC